MAREAPALVTEKKRLAKIGGRFLGIIGDANHSFGYHVPAVSLPGNDYSVVGQNRPPADRHASCAIDIGMNWKASRQWLKWLIKEIRTDRIKGIAEVIGSYDGRNVRYWSDSSGWSTNGVAYQGSGHDTWTHVAIYRNNVTTDRGLLKGWTATGHKGDDMELSDKVKLSSWILKNFDGLGKTISVQTALGSTYGHARSTKEYVLRLEKSSKLRDEAILKAVQGLDTDSILAAIDARAAEDAQRDAALAELVEGYGDGTLQAGEVADRVVELIAGKLADSDTGD